MCKIFLYAFGISHILGQRSNIFKAPFKAVGILLRLQGKVLLGLLQGHPVKHLVYTQQQAGKQQHGNQHNNNNASINRI